ncbi:peptidylprolyl isomerase, partial [Staphylococcus epidermidis]|uniref:peptidylprolyl isomerase n=1 Tax=Staphylococcus epidermidis TaxID=1282 RepID=UPI0037D9E7F8
MQHNQIKLLIHTNKPHITFKLFPHIPPNTLQNFLTHSKNAYYHALTFHPLINHFMVQRPDPTPTGVPRESI